MSPTWQSCWASHFSKMANLLFTPGPHRLTPSHFSHIPLNKTAPCFFYCIYILNLFSVCNLHVVVVKFSCSIGLKQCYQLVRIKCLLVAQSVKNLPAVQETWVWSLGWEDPCRRAWLPTPVFLPRESPWTEEPGGLQSMGLQRVGHDWET